MNSHRTQLELSRPRRGMTFVEVTFSTMMVGIVLVGAMDLLGAVVRGRTSTVSSARAEQIAHQLMAEILTEAYQDSTSPVFGLEADEPVGVRSGYDDVDDYHNLAPLTLLGLDGVLLPNTTGWRTQVTVEYVVPTNPAVTSLTDQGVKRITVAVTKNGQVLTRLVALRTNKYTVP